MLYLFCLYNFANIFSHYEYMTSCISNQPVLLTSKNIPDLIDHRNFYNKYDPEAKVQVGYSACGLSRNVVAKMLLASDVFFGDKDFLKSLPEYINNPSVARFMMEMAVLSSIQSTGLKLAVLAELKIPAEINCPMRANLFRGRIPNLDSNTEKPVLLVPQAWNFRAIDGVIDKKTDNTIELWVMSDGSPSGVSEKGLYTYPNACARPRAHGGMSHNNIRKG